MHPYGCNLMSSWETDNVLGKGRLVGSSYWETVESPTVGIVKEKFHTFSFLKNWKSFKSRFEYSSLQVPINF